MSTHHVGSVDTLLLGDGFIALCICGWKGPERQTEADAKTDLGRHYDEVENEP